MHELTKYRDSIKEMYSEMRSTLSEKDIEHFFGKSIASIKVPKISKDGGGGGGPSGRKDQLERSLSPHPSSGSSYEPFSPQVVEVKVNVDPDSDLKLSDPYHAISSPDSEPELKIDCDYEPEPKKRKESKRPGHSVSPQPHKTDKIKGNFSSKKNYPTHLGLVNKGKGIHGTGLQFTKKTPLNSDSPQKMIPTPTGFKPIKGTPGAVLSSLATHLAEKKRAEMNGFQDSPKKTKHASSTVIIPPTSGSPINEETQGEEVSASLKSAFSSAYPPEKTAIAVVDPENKRVRKRKQVYTGTPDVQPSKRKPARNNSPVRPHPTSSKHASSVSYHKNTPQVKNTGLTFDEISAIWVSETGGGMASEGASPSVVIEPETSSDSEVDDIQNKEGGLLESTIQHVYQAFTTKVKSIRGKSSNDMGYRYYSEKVSPISYMPAIIKPFTADVSSAARFVGNVIRLSRGSRIT